MSLGAMDLFQNVPPEVSVYEVSPRDGLQNEPIIVPLAGKVQLIEALAQAGLKRIEATSFVSPKWVPQLADAGEVIAALPKIEGVTFSALVPNARGLERALEVGLPEIAVFLSASETHNKMNVNKTIDATLDVFREIVPPAIEAGVRVRAYVSTVWGCPYEGDIPVAKSVRIAKRLVELGCYQVSLGDTIGVGTPKKTFEIVGAVLSEMQRDQIALHFHDTRGTALANAVIGLELGIRTFDASVGGLGGCPYAPGASGNLATEDLVYMLHGMGVTTGIDLDKLLYAGQVASQVVARPLSGKVHQAGTFKLRKV
ncbi:MAG: hydroxymethylglutaryl-CoA lyase [Polyangiaceae bacterium]|nr:hydroxymethylglutaryl-CoA lyase [Polyangiaceae bacterium]